MPARPRKPKDKAKVDVGVQIVERWIVARLRKRQFFSLDQANAATRPLLDELNSKVTRHFPDENRNCPSRKSKGGA